MILAISPNEYTTVHFIRLNFNVNLAIFVIPAVKNPENAAGGTFNKIY
jgi:hypothetical protein